MNTFNLFNNHKPYWHLVTDGREMQDLFRSDEEFTFGINTLAASACRFPEIKIFTFVLMDNHVHIILSGDGEQCLQMFTQYKWKLSRGLKDKTVDWSKVRPKLLPVESLYYLKDVIAYVNRNAYVAHTSYTPYNYPWGAAREFFSYKEKRMVRRFTELRFNEKKALLHSHDFNEDYNKLCFEGDMVTIDSFCDIELAEQFYDNANDYMACITKHVEQYSEIAQTLGDRIILTDNEMNKLVYIMLRKEYNTEDVVCLTPKQKITFATDLKNKYNATKKQLKRLLNLDMNTLEELFPSSRTGSPSAQKA